MCASDTALTRLGNLQLTICGISATIKKYSKFDKLYYVDLRRLPPSASDPVIYDYFVALGERPVMITLTQVHGQINSRDRTIYFNRTECPPVLKTSDQDAVREIYFEPDNQDEKPCFLKQHTARFNRVTTPSLRKHRRGSDVSITSAPTVVTANRSGTAPFTPTLPGSASACTPDASTTTPSTDIPLVGYYAKTKRSIPLDSSSLGTPSSSLHVSDRSRTLGSSWVCCGGRTGMETGATLPIRGVIQG
eukprot:jgi/Phyca11/554701/estExt2_Genewise1Plus.C_PHYCAscaffold_640143